MLGPPENPRHHRQVEQARRFSDSSSAGLAAGRLQVRFGLQKCEGFLVMTSSC
jgi:hypothetical protein